MDVTPLQVIEHAYDLFGSVETTIKWLNSSPNVLQHKCNECEKKFTIAELLDSGNPEYINEIDICLHRIEHGIPS